MLGWVALLVRPCNTLELDHLRELFSFTSRDQLFDRYDPISTAERFHHRRMSNRVPVDPPHVIPYPIE